jgi:putative alpha-1,2-mannosidase
LIGRFGGPAAAVARLDDLFTELNSGADRPYAWIGNEPSLSAPWAYDFAPAPARTQAVVRRIQRELFDAGPSGLPGNDDGGTTSAWYVFSALGLFPTVPGVAGVSLGSPVFADAVVHLANGRTLHIVGHGAAADAPYVQDVHLDGESLAAPWLDWARLADGATLEFSLGRTPTDWGTTPGTV